MQVDKFFDNFELLADAPNAVAKLREIVLQLAVRGKLVPQKLNESALVLLKEIRAKRGEIELNFSAFEENNGEKLFAIPDNWQWVRFAEIVRLEIGKTPSRKELRYWLSEDYPWVSIRDMKHLEVLDVTKEYASQAAYDEVFKGRISKKGTLLMSFKLSIGKLSILGMDAFHNEAIVSVYPYIPQMKDYLFRCLSGFDLTFEKSNAIKGSTLNKSSLQRIAIALPPLAEQKRIVEKCDCLLSFCDQIEVKQRKRQESIVKMNESAIAQLLCSQNPDELNQHWEGICNNFDLLYSIPETIPKLRQAILQLAVQGKLVSQNSNDEPTFILLEKIQLIKEQLIKQQQIEKGISLQAIASDEIPYELPATWEWIQIGQLVLLMDAGWSPSCKQYPTKNSETWGVLKTTAVQRLNFQWQEHKELPQNLNPRPEYEVKIGDILITRAGPKNRVGICCLVKDTRPKLMISDKIIRFHLIEKFLFPDFVVLSLNAGFSQSYIESQKSGMAESQMNISQAKLRTTPVPIPPLAEQKRIVAKVDRLMSLCDTLEAKLKDARSHSNLLMEVAAKQLLTV